MHSSDSKGSPHGGARNPEPADAQRGAVLTALMLVLVLGSGAATLGWLEAAARSAHAARRTEAAVAAARDSLIGYAASYPDQHANRHGPGYLPCPDTSGNGSPNTPCGRGSIGRIPWRRLGLHDPRDGTGEILWYAIADNFRANGYKHRPLNRETRAELEVDGIDGYAAVVVAPGLALSFQHRDRDRFDPAQYLEGGNETAADRAYVSGAAGFSPADSMRDRFNDRIGAISRDEVMRAAGARVLAEIAALLRRYRRSFSGSSAYPWLVPWAGRNDVEGVLAVPGTVAGRLPLVRAGDSFETSFRVSGSPAGGSVSVSGTLHADPATLPPRGLFVPAGRCEWTVAERIDCEGEARIGLGSGRERHYRLSVHLSGSARVVPPGASDVRRREVQGVEWHSDSYLEIVDREAGTETGRGRIEFAPSPVLGSVSVEGVGYPFGAGDEVPPWLVENEWHASMLIGIGPAFAPGGDANAGCAFPRSCLELHRAMLDGTPRHSRIGAAAILAGAPLRHQNRAVPELGAWFEGENAQPGNLRYEARNAGDFFNDQIVALAAPSGGPGS